MHEMSLLHDVLDIVLNAVDGSNVKAVTKVVLAVGDMRDVVDEYVPNLFKRLARGTVAEDAEIGIIHVPITARCRQCGYVLPIDPCAEATWCCPSCKTYKDFRLMTGNEFIVKSIEVEEDMPHSYVA